MPCSSLLQKRSFVRLGRFPADFCSLRNPLQSGLLSGAVPAVEEAWFFFFFFKKGPSVDLLSSTESGRPDGSELLWEAGTERPEWANNNNNNCRPPSSSPTLAHFRSRSAWFHRSRSSVSCFVFLAACCSPTGLWINLHVCLNNGRQWFLKSHNSRLCFFCFIIWAAQQKVVASLQGWVWWWE